MAGTLPQHVAQDDPKIEQDVPGWPQNGTKMAAQDCPKIAPKKPKMRQVKSSQVKPYALQRVGMLGTQKSLPLLSVLYTILYITAFWARSHCMRPEFPHPF